MHILVLLLLYLFFLLVPVCRKCFYADFQITFRFVLATTAEIFLVSTNTDIVFLCA